MYCFPSHDQNSNVELGSLESTSIIRNALDLLERIKFQDDDRLDFGTSKGNKQSSTALIKKINQASYEIGLDKTALSVVKPCIRKRWSHLLVNQTYGNHRKRVTHWVFRMISLLYDQQWVLLQEKVLEMCSVKWPYRNRAYSDWGRVWNLPTLRPQTHCTCTVMRGYNI